MKTFKRFLGAAAASPLAWIFGIIGSMVLFILIFEKPVNFAVNKIYGIF